AIAHGTPSLHLRRFMIALWARNRKIRGLGLPGCALAVTVPISMNPNPSAAHARRATPFLSRPAESPIAFGKLRPKSVFGFDDGRKHLSTRSARPKCEALPSNATVK